jgi:hypothetical protein
VRLTIDTEADTYEQAIATVQAAYGLRPVTPCRLAGRNHHPLTRAPIRRA